MLVQTDCMLKNIFFPPCIFRLIDIAYFISRKFTKWVNWTHIWKMKKKTARWFENAFRQLYLYHIPFECFAISHNCSNEWWHNLLYYRIMIMKFENNDRISKHWQWNRSWRLDALFQKFFLICNSKTSRTFGEILNSKYSWVVENTWIFKTG